MKELILIRHGQTEGNRLKKYMGHLDLSLNKEGKKEAARLKKIFKKEKIDSLFSSDLKRCIETAEFIKTGKKIQKTEQLREVNFGIFENLTYEEMKKKYPKQVEEWGNDWINYQPENGESVKIMSNRVIKFVDSLLENKNEKIIIVTHHGCISAILAHYITGSIKGCSKFKINNAAVTRLCFDKQNAYLKSLNSQ